MDSLISFVTTLEIFLEKKEKTLHLGNNTLIFSENREYIIPDFQREIRWDKDDLAQLIDDLSSSPIFLGNIILTKKDNNFFIIDGQQRITILTMILYCIILQYKKQIEVLEPVIIQIESLPFFKELLENQFNVDVLEDPNNIKDDKLNQRKKYADLWDAIYENAKIKHITNAKGLLCNIKKSKINIILDQSEYISDGIGYFIDVNLKGKQLDTEDIFKAYLFKNDTTQEIRDEWYSLKINVEKLSSLGVKKYSILDIIEQYLYCQLFLNPKYKGIEFNEKFVLKKEILISEDSSEPYRKGLHIIEVINDKSFILSAFQDINRIIATMISFLENSVSSSLINQFFYVNGKAFDDIEKKIIINFIVKILRDEKILPKSLIMKYFIDLQNNPNKTKSLIQKIYGVYTLSTLFTIFESKKRKDVFIPILKANDENWYTELIKQISSYFKPEKITDYRLLNNLIPNEEDDDNNEDWQFRCKSLATIYNFFVIHDNEVKIKAGKMRQLDQFIFNSHEYSLEHFIINKTCNAKIKIEEEKEDISLPVNSKYTQNLFNFIFIPQEENERLENYWFIDKLDLIDKSKIKCEYSLMFLDSIQYIRTHFQENYPITKENYENQLKLFFLTDFKGKYTDFARVILQKVVQKINNQSANIL